MGARQDLERAVAEVTAGAWAIGVSGGADSVALLELLRARADLSLCIVHLDHETRSGASTDDARFVEELAAKWKLPVVVGKRSDIEAGMGAIDSNKSARFRAARLELFRRVVAERGLAGVILAHHADDQAETIFQRLLRGAGPPGLRGMRERTAVGGLTILRPMLGVRRKALRRVLVERSIPWCEDASNRALDQQRNRVREMLAGYEALTEAVLRLGSACGRWMNWLSREAPALGESFAMRELEGLPGVVAEFAARRWLSERIGHRREIPAAAAARLLEMASDAASPPRSHFPG